MWRSYATGLSILLIYLMTTFRFLAPVVHYQLDYAYISEVLCLNRDKPELNCKGKCQLRKSLKALHSDNSGKDQSQRIAFSYHSIEDVPGSHQYVAPLLNESVTAPMQQYLLLLNTRALPSLFHPPQV